MVNYNKIKSEISELKTRLEYLKRERKNRDEKIIQNYLDICINTTQSELKHFLDNLKECITQLEKILKG